MHGIPVLVYGTSAIKLSNADLNTISRAYDSIFVKLYNTSEKNTILQCQYYSGCLPLHLLYDINRYNFLNKLINSGNLHQELEIDYLDFIDYESLQNKYNLNKKESGWTVKAKIWKYFENVINCLET